MLFDKESKMSENGPFLQQGESDEFLRPTHLIKRGRRETGAVSSFKFYYKRKQRTVKRFLLLKKWEK